MTDDFAKRLAHITRDCRPDMHEPDEQGLSAHVVGDHLDNAQGEWITSDAVVGRCQELVVVLRRDSEDGVREVQRFNLATLIAFARRGGL